MTILQEVTRREGTRVHGQGRPFVALLVAFGMFAAQGCSQSEAETPAQPQYGTIEAQNFVVRSPDGKMRAEFGMTAQRRFELVIYDDNQKRRATLGEQGLMLFNAQEKPQARLDLMGDTPRLNFLDADGDVRYSAP